MAADVHLSGGVLVDAYGDELTADMIGAPTREEFDSATSALVNERPTAVVMGTSLENQAGLGPESVSPADINTDVHSRGWWHWMNGFLGQAFQHVAKHAISGGQSAGFVSTQLPAVLATDADWVFVGGPVNDPGNGVATATTIANMTAVFDALTDAGKRVVALNVSPSTSYNTAGRRQSVYDLNEWYATLPRLYPNLYVVDVHKVTVDPASSQDPYTDMTVDGVHHTSTGAARIGKAVADAIAHHVPVVPHRVIHPSDPLNICGNPHFASGTGWTVVAGTPASVTTDFTTIDPDTFRTIGKFTLTDSDLAERGIQYLENISSGRFAVGDVVRAVGRVRWSNLVADPATAARCAPYLRIRPRKIDNSFPATDGNGGAGEAITLGGASAESRVVRGFPSSGEMVVATYGIKIPADVDRLYFMCGWFGADSGVFEWTDVSFFKDN